MFPLQRRVKCFPDYAGAILKRKNQLVILELYLKKTMIIVIQLSALKRKDRALSNFSSLKSVFVKLRLNLWWILRRREDGALTIHNDFFTFFSYSICAIFLHLLNRYNPKSGHEKKTRGRDKIVEN